MTIAWGLQPLLDRMGEVRPSLDELAAAWSSDRSRLLLVDERGGVALSDGSVLGVPTGGDFDEGRDVLLGESGGLTWFGRRGAVDGGVTLRDHEFAPAERELVTAATAVLAWHDGAGFCERCGQPSVVVSGGFQRRCTGCGREIFPRTDPAMIVAVLDTDDRLLLAHQASWPEGRVSVLAGFLEAGESAEHAVVREVHEESGLHVVDAKFIASEPWPDPRSLMLGFMARATGEIAVDEQEIAWARWYTPEDLTAAEAEGLTLPGKGSIAGRMIDAWRNGELDSSPLAPAKPHA